ncbi:MAG TPA: hypothetical protein VN442_04065, partial [Bryobacteraceae bacterium]|nr:hypothetical protein [Bryobacteraceae bacterium]
RLCAGQAKGFRLVPAKPLTTGPWKEQLINSSARRGLAGKWQETVVCGSNKNLLGPLHGNLKPGMVGPGNFRSGPDGMPPGAAYTQEPYGLMEAFTLLGR